MTTTSPTDDGTDGTHEEEEEEEEEDEEEDEDEDEDEDEEEEERAFGAAVATNTFLCVSKLRRSAATASSSPMDDICMAAE